MKTPRVIPPWFPTGRQFFIAAFLIIGICWLLVLIWMSLHTVGS